MLPYDVVVSEKHELRSLLPGFKFWLHVTEAEWLWVRYLTFGCQFLHLKMRIIITYPRGLWWEVNDLMYVKGLKQCLLLNRHPINTNYCYCCVAIMISIWDKQLGTWLPKSKKDKYLCGKWDREVISVSTAIPQKQQIGIEFSRVGKWAGLQQLANKPGGGTRRTHSTATTL